MRVRTLARFLLFEETSLPRAYNCATYYPPPFSGINVNFSPNSVSQPSNQVSNPSPTLILTTLPIYVSTLALKHHPSAQRMSTIPQTLFPFFSHLYLQKNIIYANAKVIAPILGAVGRFILKGSN